MIVKENRWAKNLMSPMEIKAYNCWYGIKQRCYKPNFIYYRHYGGRGITMDQRWQADFAEFVKDAGLPPAKGYDLDRINNNGNYEPGNVRWVTHRENLKNMRSNRPVTIDGVTKLSSEWADQAGISRPAFFRRLEAGWTGKALLKAPQYSGYGELLILKGVARTIDEWAKIIGISDIGLRTRIKRGYSEQQLLKPSAKWKKNQHNRKPPENVKKENRQLALGILSESDTNLLDDGATRPKESQDASETGRDLHEEDKGERAG